MGTLDQNVILNSKPLKLSAQRFLLLFKDYTDPSRIPKRVLAKRYGVTRATLDEYLGNRAAIERAAREALGEGATA